MAEASPLNGYGPLDSDSVVRAAATLNADETSSENTFTLEGGSPLDQGYAVVANFPTTPTGTSPSVKVNLKASDAGDLIEVTHTDAIDSNTTYPFTLVLPVPPSRSENWEVEFDVSGTSPVFANVSAYVTRRVHAKVDA